MEGIVTGAAALQPRLARVFNAAGIRVREGYGQTETSPVLCFNRFEEGDYRIGTVGPAIPGVEIRIAENGEILAKGPNIMLGYYKRTDLTQETIDNDGWLHTGDVGQWIEGRFLKITDRIKELFKTSGGKYVAPQPLENKMKESHFIDQIMVVGDGQKFVAALIQPAFDNALKWAAENGHDIKSAEDVAKSKIIRTRIREDIDKFNRDFSHVEQIKDFRMVPDVWSVESGELTPTMKLRRKVVLEKYRGVVEEIYGNRVSGIEYKV